MFLYMPDPVNYDAPSAIWLKQLDANFDKLAACDAKAKANGSLVGRYIDYPVADGKAFYQVIRENKKTVRIRSCKGIGDDYTVSFWGEETSIPKTYAQQNIQGRDMLSELFGKKTPQA